jgi:Zn-dependent protease/CBS domain-containing protein
MGWSFEIGRVFGIPVRIHFTFLILLLFVGFTPSGSPMGWSFDLPGVILVGLVFSCVLLHELGHSLLARRYGVQVDNITLLPIGGVAAMRSLPHSPRVELLVALAGPAVSVALGLLFALAARQRYGPIVWPILLHDPGNMPLLLELASINFSLTAFNLVPAFPMDGGRVLRSVLWSRTGFLRATQVATRIGQGLAILCFILALTGHLGTWLVLIAIFIYLGADAEIRSAAWVEMLSTTTVAQAMETNLQSLPAGASIQDAAPLMSRTGQENFPVVSDGKSVGLLIRPHLFQAMRNRQFTRPVADFMTRELIYCRPQDNLATVIQHMDRRNLSCVVVMEGNEIVGIITPELWHRIGTKVR